MQIVIKYRKKNLIFKYLRTSVLCICIRRTEQKIIRNNISVSHKKIIILQLKQLLLGNKKN